MYSIHIIGGAFVGLFTFNHIGMVVVDPDKRTTRFDARMQKLPTYLRPIVSLARVVLYYLGLFGTFTKRYLYNHAA